MESGDQPLTRSELMQLPALTPIWVRLNTHVERQRFELRFSQGADRRPYVLHCDNVFFLKIGNGLFADVVWLEDGYHDKRNLMLIAEQHTKMQDLTPDPDVPALYDGPIGPGEHIPHRVGLKGIYARSREQRDEFMRTDPGYVAAEKRLREEKPEWYREVERKVPQPEVDWTPGMDAQAYRDKINAEEAPTPGMIKRVLDFLKTKGEK